MMNLNFAQDILESRETLSKIAETLWNIFLALCVIATLMFLNLVATTIGLIRRRR